MQLLLDSFVGVAVFIRYWVDFESLANEVIDKLGSNYLTSSPAIVAVMYVILSRYVPSLINCKTKSLWLYLSPCQKNLDFCTKTILWNQKPWLWWTESKGIHFCLLVVQLWGFIGYICICEFYISSSIGWTTLLPSPSHQEGNARCPVYLFLYCKPISNKLCFSVTRINLGHYWIWAATRPSIWWNYACL